MPAELSRPSERCRRVHVSKLRQYATKEEVEAAGHTYNDGKRIEQIICAKLLAELLATSEDLGAQGNDIYHRTPLLRVP